MRFPSILAASLFLLGFARTSSAEVSPFPQDYWERGYPAGGSQPSTVINLSMKVKSLAKAEVEIDKRLTKLGASLTAMNDNAYWEGPSGGARPKSKGITYSLPESKAEVAAKSLFELGELQQYNNQHPNNGGYLNEIDEKLRRLDEEINGNAVALKNMPIASHLLNSQRSRLQQSKDAYEKGRGKATMSVTIIELPEAK